MPDITFILPHWIYWGGIVAVPAAFMLAGRRFAARNTSSGISLPLAFFFWLVGGFMGLHRLYLKNWGAAAFIVLFVGIILCNHEGRQARNQHSIAKNETFNASYDLKAAEDEEADNIDELKRDLTAKTAIEQSLQSQMQHWAQTSSIIAAVIVVLLLVDALLLPGLSKRAMQLLPAAPRPPPEDVNSSNEKTELNSPADNRFTAAVCKLNRFVGEFAAYWTIIAVFVFYYEVVARYIFNSPTIWAHESMFLLFGMQYLLAGGFCLRENSHVRVDVIYSHMPEKARAISDLVTSIFFFIFVLSLTATGWIFFYDSFSIGQVSHTEWEIPHWPIKFALPLGGFLIFLQGLAHVLRDIAKLRMAASGN